MNYPVRHHLFCSRQSRILTWESLVSSNDVQNYNDDYSEHVGSWEKKKNCQGRGNGFVSKSCSFHLIIHAQCSLFWKTFPKCTLIGIIYLNTLKEGNNRENICPGKILQDTLSALCENYYLSNIQVLFLLVKFFPFTAILHKPCFCMENHHVAPISNGAV